MLRNPILAVTAFTLLGLGSGCALGPKAIEKHHGRYAAAVQRVEEEQLLMSIVRLRYTEDSTHLTVSSIATQSEVSAGTEARSFSSSEPPLLTAGGANRFTASLSPQSDGSTVRQFLTPISADTLVFLVQTGWPVSSVLRIWVDRMNGVPNWVPPSGPQRDVSPDFARFRRATELLQIAQDRELISVHGEDGVTEVSGPIPAEAVTASAAVEAAKEGFEYRPQEGGKTWSLVKRGRRIIMRVNPAGRGSPEVAELAALLNLKPDLERYEVVLASGVPDPARNPTEPTAVLQITPRSTVQALFFLSNGVMIPPEHVAAGLVRLPPDGTDPAEATHGVFRVLSSAGRKRSPPCCAYLAVRYRDRWFYIDDRDQESKATLLLMLQLRRLDFRRQQVGNVPTLTLPVGR